MQCASLLCPVISFSCYIQGAPEQIIQWTPVMWESEGLSACYLYWVSRVLTAWEEMLSILTRTFLECRKKALIFWETQMTMELSSFLLISLPCISQPPMLKVMTKKEKEREHIMLSLFFSFLFFWLRKHEFYWRFFLKKIFTYFF